MQPPTSSPRVSVIVPNYNHAPYLRRRIDSILAQTFQDFELILMDDCSTDDSRPILTEYASKETRARLMFNEKNSGSTFKQWNKGVNAAAGEYIWLAESDDYADPGLLQRLITPLESHANIGVAYCESNVINAQDTLLRTTHNDFAGIGDRGRWAHDFIANGREECAKVLVQQNVLPNASAVLFRRSLFNDVGGADESMKLCGDWKMWASMLLRSDLAHIAEPLNFYRTHSQNVRTATRPWRWILEVAQIYRFLGSKIVVSAEILAHLKGGLADAWINAWLWRSPAETEIREMARREVRAFDSHFRLRLAQRALSRVVHTARSGKAGEWTLHLLKRPRQ